MKKFAGTLLVLVGLCGAGAYWVDLTEFTDAAKGFSASGSIWLRYGVLAVLLLIAALAGLMAARRPAAMEKKNLPLAIVLAVCGAVCAATGAVTLAACIQSGMASGVMGFGLISKSGLFGIFELLCGWWLITLCVHFGTGTARMPAGGVAFGALGSLFFLILTLARFAGNYSSIYRFAQTVQTFSALAALLLTAVWLRVTIFPESSWGRREYITGMWAFYLCTCCEVPQGVARYLAGQTAFSELALSILLGCIGVAGAVTALSTLGREADEV